MRFKNAVIVAVFVIVSGASVSAQQAAKAPRGPRTPPASPAAAANGDTKSVLFNWMWYTGMLRGVQEVDSVATLELHATGTMMLANQACKLTDYRISANYQVSGMRVQYACTTPDGQAHKGIEVVSGQYAWDEDKLGAGLAAGYGTATPKKAALNDRVIWLWASPQGAPKAAAAGGTNTKVSVEGGKAVVTYPIPGVPGATAKATLSAQNQAEKVEVHQGSDVYEFTYEKYGDYNTSDNKVYGYLPGHMVEKKNGMTIMDLTTKETEVGNLYVVIPVPDSVKKAS